MVRGLLLRGMLVGVAAGLLAFLTAHALGEPQVNKAIDFESYVAAVHHEPEEAEAVSRDVQSTIGLGAGSLLYTIAFGGLFALVFAAAYGRLGTRTVRGTSAALGLMGLLGVYVVPNLKYPANPPSVGSPDTIDHRTTLYLLMLVASLALMALAVVVRKRCLPRLGEWNATLVAAGVFVVGVVVCFLAFPGVDEVPQRAIPGVVHAVTDAGVTFPPTVLWRFRVASLAVQVVIWGALSLGFGVLAQRFFDRERPGFGSEPAGAGG
jgi:hypothetical protein